MKKTNILLGSAVVLASLVNVGSVFAADVTGGTATPNSAETTVSTTLTVPTTSTPKAPTDPDDPTNGLNDEETVTGEDGNLGIAYYPGSFKFQGTLNNSSNLVLTDSGNNTTSSKATYNIGVKDNTHTNNSWTLYATLTWTKGNLPGSTIMLANDTGEVKQNINDGTTPFALSDLVSQTPTQVVTGQSNVSIGSTQVKIMEKADTTIGIGTYDYQLGGLGKLKLNIPDAISLKAGDYAGTVTWNLSVTPGTAVGTN